jgi:chromosome segregation ATPase
MINILSQYTTPIKIAVIAATVAAIIGYVVMLRGQIDTANEKLATVTANYKILESNEAVLKSNLLVCAESNEENQATIDMFIAQQKKAKEQIEWLAKQRSTSAKELQDLKAEIDRIIKSDPSSDSPAASSLYNTIKNIKETRK